MAPMPGIMMPANRSPGMTYRQEYYAGQAEDTAPRCSASTSEVEVPFGIFDQRADERRTTRRWSPTSLEHKFYAAGRRPGAAH